MTTGARIARVAPLIRQELMRLIISEVQDPRVGFVTLTEVDMTPDLKQAHVWVSIIGPAEKVSDSLRGLRAAATFLRRALAGSLELRQVPALTFHHDTGLDYAERINALLARDEGRQLVPTIPLPTPEVHRDVIVAPPQPAQRGRRRRRR